MKEKIIRLVYCIMYMPTLIILLLTYPLYFIWTGKTIRYYNDIVVKLIWWLK